MKTTSPNPESSNNITWVEVPIADIGTVALKPGSVIPDIIRSGQFDSGVEAAICRTLKTDKELEVSGGDPRTTEKRLMDKPLSGILVSKASRTSTPQLQWGFAVMLPFTLERFGAHSTMYAKNEQQQRLLTPNTPGFDVLFGYVQTSKGSFDSVVFQDATYTRKPVTSSTESKTFGLIRRTLGARKQIRDIEQEMVALREPSGNRAAGLAQLALRYLSLPKK